MSDRTPNADARFYVTMAVVSALLIFAGFAPSFYLKPVLQAPPPLSPLTILHGVVFTAWTLLFIAQAAFIASARPAVHRRVGLLGAVLFGFVIALAGHTALTAGRLGHAPPASPPPLAFMALPLFALAGATVLAVAAFWNGRRSDWHQRLMLAALFMTTGPGSARIALAFGQAAASIWVSFVGAELLLAVAMVRDYRVHRRLHPAYAWAAAVYAATHVAVYQAFGSPAWLEFARVLTAG